jgi:hypothetical protein
MIKYSLAFVPYIWDLPDRKVDLNTKQPQRFSQLSLNTSREMLPIHHSQSSHHSRLAYETASQSDPRINTLPKRSAKYANPALQTNMFVIASTAAAEIWEVFV